MVACCAAVSLALCAGMSLLPQQQQLSSSYSPARPLIPSGRTPGSAQQQLLRQQQQQQQQAGDLSAQQQGATAMVTSPAPVSQGQGQQAGLAAGLTGQPLANNLFRTTSMGTGGGDYLSSSLAQSFNHNLMMSPINSSMAAMLAAARQQHQQQAAAAAAASSMGMVRRV